jgi:ATP-dependent RNA helicase DeaD
MKEIVMTENQCGLSPEILKNNKKRDTMVRFKALGLTEKSIQALHKKGFEEPTEIQILTIPLLLKNEKDIIAQAQTGTGKTAVFALPLIERLNPSAREVQAIILAPTRELVIQVCEEINSLKGDNPMTVSPIYGGQSMELQLKKLRQGLSIVVGTPGRILDHIRRKSLRLDSIRYFILDEADEMLNMGFIEDIEKILEHTPSVKRVLLFSATMPGPIKKLAEKYMGDYIHVKTKTALTTHLTDQIYFEVAKQDKFEALCRIVDVESAFYGLVFCRTKTDVDALSAQLTDRGYSADGLHGDLSQGQREKVLGRFRKQQISILVATDVAARGIDVYNLSHVINYSIPHNPEAYIHRIGRTGRAGNQGTAITFVTPAEFRKLGFIRRIANATIRKENVPEVGQIILARKQKISEEIERIVYNNETDGYRKWARRILGEHPPEDVIAAILKYSFGKTLDESNYGKLSSAAQKKRGRTLIEEEGKTRLFIAKGKNSNTTKKNLVDFILKKANTPQDLIENIEIYNNFSFITVPFAEAEVILNKFRKVRVGKRAVVVKARPQ